MRHQYDGALRQPFNAFLVPAAHSFVHRRRPAPGLASQPPVRAPALVGRNLAAQSDPVSPSESGYAITARERGAYLKATHWF